MTSSNFETAQAKIHNVEPLSMTLNAKLMLFYVVLIKSQKLDVTQFYITLSVMYTFIFIILYYFTVYIFNDIFN
jgi:membrane protein YdbS with pleckstrin-like domain